MSKEVLESWMPSTIAELREALNEMVVMCIEGGGDPDTIYVDVRYLSLVKQTLTDGSVVFNTVVRENR